MLGSHFCKWIAPVSIVYYLDVVEGLSSHYNDNIQCVMHDVLVFQQMITVVASFCF
jgi:hypothetical protein